MEKYNPKEIEQKWQDIWEKNRSLSSADEKSDKDKFYCLDMFPYPSGEGLHVGHVESYTATDIISRYQRMKGKNVLHPQGWDAFGLPAENYAIKTKTHPSITTKKAIENFKKQIKMLGFSYDWSREVNSSDPDYYKWTQWFFILLYKNGLAYKKKAKVNWCSKCQTVLANEQAEGGICERCETEVVQKDLEQWFFKITDFAEELLSGLDYLDWPQSTKSAQRNWIGKSEGAEFNLPVILTPPWRGKNLEQNKVSDKIQGSFVEATQDDKYFIEVYTTRLDTVFGMTYAVVAPEHPIIEKLKDKIENYGEIEKYIANARKKTELERTALQKEKTGVELEGIKVINPFTSEEIPVYVADYVVGHYGTGAVMAVPAHDERDFEFAKKYDLPIKEVIKSKDGSSFVDSNAFAEDGILVNSDKYDGLISEKAQEEMAMWLGKEKIGKKKINYKLRDWLISRQRYWGAPIPIIYCEKCGEVPVPEKDLPVELPTDVDFKPTGESPLNYSKKFQDVKCPKCGGKAKRESDTMDTFVCSSWYYFRYADPKNEKEFASKEQIKKWLPVDLYVGGAEHTVLHLLYARFFTKVLNKLGYIDFGEPFKKLRHQGIILAEDGNKMSKSKGNVVNPDDVVKEFGADALRLFEMFMGPLEDAKPWNTKGIVGMRRFLEKIWNFSYYANFSQGSTGELSVSLNKTIKKVSDDIEKLKFNTAISSIMIFINIIYKTPGELRLSKSEAERKMGQWPDNISGSLQWISKEDFEKFIKLLAPFIPYIAEEIWKEKLEHKESIFKEKWPEYDPALVKDEEIELVIQVNGKLRDRIKVSADISEEEATKLAMESEKAKQHISGKEIKKVIFVKNKLVNIVL